MITSSTLAAATPFNATGLFVTAIIAAILIAVFGPYFRRRFAVAPPAGDDVIVGEVVSNGAPYAEGTQLGGFDARPLGLSNCGVEDCETCRPMHTSEPDAGAIEVLEGAGYWSAPATPAEIFERVFGNPAGAPALLAPAPTEDAPAPEAPMSLATEIASADVTSAWVDPQPEAEYAVAATDEGPNPYAVASVRVTVRHVSVKVGGDPVRLQAEALNAAGEKVITKNGITFRSHNARRAAVTRRGGAVRGVERGYTSIFAEAEGVRSEPVRVRVT